MKVRTLVMLIVVVAFLGTSIPTQAGRMRIVKRKSMLSYSESVFKSFLKKKFDSGKLNAKEQIDFLSGHAGAKTRADVINYYWKNLKEIHDQLKQGSISYGGFGVESRRPEYNVHFSIMKKHPNTIQVYVEWREGK